MKWMAVIALAAVATTFASTAHAQDYEDMEMAVESPYSLTPSETKGPFYEHSAAEMRTRKLCRGLANIFLCVGEVPNQMFQEVYRTSPVTGSVVGFFKGLGKGAQRLVVGTWETLTFYHPAPDNYQPIVEPEVVFQEYLH